MNSLKQSKQWVCWKYESDKKGKPTKIPKNPKTVGNAMSNNPKTWASFEHAKKASEKYDGIGFMFANGICGIDIDNKQRDPQLEAQAQEIIQFMDTYTEYSPSGTGYHLIFRCDISKIPTVKIYVTNKETGQAELKTSLNPVYYQKNPHNGLECYFSSLTNRFFTYTGEAVNSRDIEDRTEQVLAFLDHYMRKPEKPKQDKPKQDKQYQAQPSDLSAQEILRKAATAKNGNLFQRLWAGDITGFNSHSEADLSLCNILAFYSGRDRSLMDLLFRQSGLMRDKWDRVQAGTTYGAITIEKACADCREVYTGPVRINAAQYFEEANMVSTEQWEQPIPFDSITVPSFPIDCLPPALSEYVTAVSEATQTPIDMAAASALSVIAVCVQGKYKIQGKPDWIEPLNLYSAVVANPAERKSAIIALLTKYINEYEYKYNEANAEDVNRSRLEKNMLIKEINYLSDKLAKGKGDKETLLQKQDELTNFKEVNPLRLLADDISPEALTSLLAANNGKMSVISSEGGIFEILQGRYSQSVNIDTFLKAHCGDPIRVDRKGRESELIKEPCLTVLLSIQPQVLDGLVGNEVFRGRGLTARFLYCMPTSSVGIRKFETEEIPSQCKARYRELCFDLLDIKPEENAEVLYLSPEAYALSAAFANELEPRLVDDLEGMADWAGKLHGAILRLAGILHIVDQLVFAPKTPISAETVQNAIRLGYYFLEHARAAYQLMGANEEIREAKYVLGKIEKQRLEKFTKRDLVRLCRKYKSTEQLNNPLNFLLQNSYLREQQQPYSGTGRQPEALYIVNPICLRST